MRNQSSSNVTTLAKFKDDADLKEKIDQVESDKHSWKSTLWLTYASLGIVYGDIGTSPLYTISGIFSNYDSPPTEVQMLGAMSLIFWSLTAIVLVKYVLIVLRANDKGEGGTFALYTRLCRSLGIKPTWGSMPKEDIACCAESCKCESMKLSKAQPRSWLGWVFWGAFDADSWVSPFRKYAFARYTLMSVSVVATAMVIGDGVLTPAISVVSAVSGLTMRTSITQSGIVGVSIAILVVLFFIQSFGTEKVSFLFSPVIVLWMMSISGVGVYNLCMMDGLHIIKGLSPQYIILFFQDQGTQGWLSLGGVMLALTGAEALFADLGHFNINSITFSFSFIIYPCLVINYLGQMAYLMVNPEEYETIFWSSVPGPYFWPMLIIATASAIVASQALITGVFSLVRQAMQLGAFPQWKVLHTGRKVEGQVYIGSINFILMVLCIAVVAGFNGNGTTIGNAYGIAVSTVFLITDQLIALVMVIDWKISKWLVILYWIFFSVVDGAYLSANLVKIPEGGWFALAITAGVALVNFIWLTGNQAKERAIKAARPRVELAEVIAPSLALADDDLGKFFACQAAAGPTYLASASFPRHTTKSAAELSRNPGSRIHSSSMPFSFAAAKRGSGSLTPFSIPDIQETTVTSHPDAFPAHPPGNVMRLRSIRLGEGLKRIDSGSAPGARQHQILATRSRRLGTNLSAVSSSSHQHVLTYAPSIFSGSSPMHGPDDSDPPRHSGEGHGDVRVDLGHPQDPSSAVPLPPRPPHHNSHPSGGGGGGGGPGPVAEASEECGCEETLPKRSPSLASHVPTEFIEQCVGVATLRGIGIYYTDQNSGIPPVMWHFLKNIEGLHQFVILLQVRVMPIPFLEPGERLVAVPVDNLPCFYRVAARYGYLEEINHGPEFIEELICHISEQLGKAAWASDPLGGLKVMSSGGTHGPSHNLERITEADGDADQARISLDLSVLSVQAAAKSAGIEPSASRVALDTLLNAFETSGVVYYTIGVNLRMKKMSFFISQLGHDFWYDSLFKQLFINQYNESDFWSIPNDSLVELSIAIDI